MVLYALQIRRRDFEFSSSNLGLPRVRAGSQHLRLQFIHNNCVVICIIVRRDKQKTAVQLRHLEERIRATQPGHRPCH